MVSARDPEAARRPGGGARTAPRPREGELLGRSRPWLAVRAGPLCTAVVVALASARSATHSAISASTKRT